jgi:hypothetical protein
MPTELLLLLGLFAVVGVWMDGLRQHEHAVRAAQRICASHDVQLLDHTVGLATLKLRRHSHGVRLERTYAFEVSIDGQDRHQGRLSLLDGRLSGVTTPWLGTARAAPTHVVPLTSCALRQNGRLSHD